MPANLTPQYLEAEKNFRLAKTPLEKIAALEEMLAVMPKHKGTDHLRAELRTRMAKLNQSLDKKTATQRASMMVEKVGAAQVTVIGLPNSGKSSIVSGVTKAATKVAEYPFTTHNAIPGMMNFENIQIQLVDTPPLTEQPPEWWHLNIIRRADGLMIVVDLADDPVFQMEIITNVLEEKRICPGDGITDENEEVPMTYKKTLLVGNKADLDEKGKGYRKLLDKYGETLPTTAVSAAGKNFDELRFRVYNMLNIIRVYTKTPGSKPDMTDPIVLDFGSTLEEGAIAVHKDFGKNLKYARIWGSGKFDGVMVKRDHILQDGDIIELHT
jgi:ribosome-interacting GTPase 1